MPRAGSKRPPPNVRRGGPPIEPVQGGPSLPNTPAQAVQAPRGLPQGQRQALEQSQAAMPVPDQRAAFEQLLGSAEGYVPSTVPLTAPSQRPDEPLTAGLPIGAGPGPENLTYAPMNTSVDELRQMYLDTGDEDIRALIEEAELEGR